MSKRYFNLLKPIKPPETLWDKIYSWILTRAKLVIIAAQILIVVFFGLKIYVDTQAKNKEQTIKKYEDDLSVFQNGKEFQFRQFFVKTQDYITLWNNSSDYASVLTEIQTIYPDLQENSSILVNNQGAVIIKGVEDTQTLNLIEKGFKNSGIFSNVALKISSGDNPDSVNFELNAQVDLSKFKRIELH